MEDKQITYKKEDFKNREDPQVIGDMRAMAEMEEIEKVEVLKY